MGLPSTSLRIGSRVIVTCDDGLLGPEYALFDRGNVVLQSDGGYVHEAGYLTSALDARQRLATLGATADRADRAANALTRGVLTTFARGAVVERVIARLGAYEVFEGATFSAATQRYQGAWLDLSELAEASNVPDAASALQALHLAAALREVDDDVLVFLSTGGATHARRPGERTFRRVSFPQITALTSALLTVPARTRARPLDPDDEAPLRTALLQRVQERGALIADESVRRRLASLHAALAEDAPVGGPLADSGLWAVERKLSSGQMGGVHADIDALERARGRLPSIQYLRARASLAQGDVAPKDIAKQLSDLVAINGEFFELALLASQASLAAGDNAHAQLFARALIDNVAVSDGIRVHALEIYESATRAAPEAAPPRASSPPPPSQAPAAPPGASQPPFAPEPAPQVSIPPTAPLPTWPGPTEGVFYSAALVETLALPDGSDESMLATGARPTNGVHARIACTRMARELARDYRLSYGTTLRTDAQAVDTMQSHLRRRFTDGQAPDPKTVWELKRHGALLSEIIARTLGGAWIDVAPTEMGYWAMLVAPSTRTWPIGRVYRFFSLGHREKDLVSYYLDLLARARGEGTA